MGQAKHTPGPWHPRGKQVRYRLPGFTTSEKLADCNTEANAILIAAAPEMLKVLHQVKLEFADMADRAGDDDHFNEGGSTYEVIQLVKAAIQKAEGL